MQCKRNFRLLLYKSLYYDNFSLHEQSNSDSLLLCARSGADFPGVQCVCRFGVFVRVLWHVIHDKKLSCAIRAQVLSLKFLDGSCRLLYMPLCTFLFHTRPLPEEYVRKVFSSFQDIPSLNWGVYMILLIFLGEDRKLLPIECCLLYMYSRMYRALVL